MSRIVLRGGVEVDNPLEVALEFLAKYSSYEADDSLGPTSFGRTDLVPPAARTVSRATRKTSAGL
jgi:hypothetical protein